jgi:hypothetical protein
MRASIDKKIVGPERKQVAMSDGLAEVRRSSTQLSRPHVVASAV